MAIGNLLRKAAEYTDKATAAAADAMEAAKAKAADLKGNDAEVYDSAITAVADAIADSGQMNSDIMAILLTIRAGNPYK
jgi:hypothetical protein